MLSRCCALLVLVSSSIPAFSAELIQPADLSREMFNAAPIKTADARGRVSEMTFAPGGTLNRKTAAGKVTEGTWRLSDEGFCMKLGAAKKESCYLVLRGGDGKMAALKLAGAPFTWTR